MMSQMSALEAEITKLAFLHELDLILEDGMEKNAIKKQVGQFFKGLFSRGGRAGGEAVEQIGARARGLPHVQPSVPSPKAWTRGLEGVPVPPGGAEAFAARTSKATAGLENIMNQRMSQIEAAMASGQMTRQQAVAELSRISKLKAQARAAGMPEHIAYGDPTKATQTLAGRPTAATKTVPGRKGEFEAFDEATRAGASHQEAAAAAAAVGRGAPPPLPTARRSLQHYTPPAGAPKPSMPGGAAEGTGVGAQVRPGAAYDPWGHQLHGARTAVTGPPAMPYTHQGTLIHTPTSAPSQTPVRDWLAQTYPEAFTGGGVDLSRLGMSVS